MASTPSWLSHVLQWNWPNQELIVLEKTENKIGKTKSIVKQPTLIAFNSYKLWQTMSDLLNSVGGG